MDDAAAPLKPFRKAFSCLCHDLELHGPAGFLLNDGRTIANASTAGDITDLDLRRVAAPQLAVDGQVEQRTVAHALVLVEVEPDGPDIAQLERTFGAGVLTCVPRTPFMHGWV